MEANPYTTYTFCRESISLFNKTLYAKIYLCIVFSPMGRIRAWLLGMWAKNYTSLTIEVITLMATPLIYSAVYVRLGSAVLPRTAPAKFLCSNNMHVPKNSLKYFNPLSFLSIFLLSFGLFSLFLGVWESLQGPLRHPLQFKR